MPEFSEDVVVIEAGLRLTDADDVDIVRIDRTGALAVRRGKDSGVTAPVLTFDPGDAEFTVGSTDRAGRIAVANKDGIAIELNAGNASIDVGRPFTAGDVTVHSWTGVDVIHLDGVNSTIRVGGSGHPGELVLQDGFERPRLAMDAQTGVLTIGAQVVDDFPGAGDVVVRGLLGRDAIRLDGANAAVTIGGTGNEGDLLVTDGNGFEAVRINGETATVYIGGNNIEGDLYVRDTLGRDAVHINGENATVVIGVIGQEGDLILQDSVGRSAMTMNGETAEMFLGSAGLEGDLIVRDAQGVDRIHLDGASGDIELMGADLAEEFAALTPIAAGTVVIATGPDEVTAAVAAADRRVVGVVSGAGDFRTALRLGARRGEARIPVALVGRVHCRAVAVDVPIQIGDLLVSSNVEGHAMRAPDEPRPGTVLGKALGGLDTGAGLIPVLLMQR